MDVDEVIANPDSVARLTEEEVEECLDYVIPLFRKEKALCELNGKTIVFVGDTHGDFETTKAVIKRFFDTDHLVFLGDYIDREPIRWGAIYNIIYLLFLKQRYPEKIILLKGNHESNHVIPCYPYEFKEELAWRYGSEGLHKKFVEVFSVMPLMVLGNNVFAAHAGILKGADRDTLRVIGKNDPVILKSVVWSDPVVSQVFRGVGDLFDGEELKEFLDDVGAKVFVRGHSPDLLGFSIYDGRCFTVFSSRLYSSMGNGGVLVAKAEDSVSDVGDLVVEDFSTGRWRGYEVVEKL